MRKFTIIIASIVYMFTFMAIGLVYTGLEEGVNCNPKLQVESLKWLIWICSTSCVIVGIFFIVSFRPGVIHSEKQLQKSIQNYNELSIILQRKINKL